VIRILLADDHPVVREGLRGMLSTEPDLEVVGEAASGPRAEALSAALLKDLARAELADAIRAAARGETVLAPSVAARLVDQLRTRPERPRLSERETAVLRLVAEGCTNAEIGRRLFIGESTVKTHLLRAFGKLGVADRTAAVTSAMRHGLL
jgi:DNA-binding NarL/FixJ family response regulator